MITSSETIVAPTEAAVASAKKKGKKGKKVAQSSECVPPQSKPGWKMSDEFADEDTDYCKLCNIYFTSAPVCLQHATAFFLFSV
jgi:hypothetical protein